MERFKLIIEGLRDEVAKANTRIEELLVERRQYLIEFRAKEEKIVSLENKIKELEAGTPESKTNG
ncbi:hypothetical protein PHYBLDRAFT_150020 [Phycomyces blakesleeanus NRRL 1555(-)]|uniref:Uncharacterized protein n=1 Tax=Phycomyces blakesleeanus (strain ATCC 8743b / DSM 1359 / FGSC 10004 / NBRC 33097 / NRRL 1555) TaxID=763407 RepID=A0A162TJ81_PHYB8|nr:hypothetical protein PHYBLDRAFT_150020 [Phycomyces blakesleeanus NRRL 1555(-)]OAD69022.1 hypothetical protein PHYBLDRAFT_150020 [Phycomyces blakesleeanus NRRL 1555(-)]|eukprot:XP_018287062.1 hypothetical protein PHYBLDRAFT_150020 [Phycomyces blakesleeanus NRRL 1555(-)]